MVDGASGFGNGRVFPAGPLREPVARAAARCQVAVLIGEDKAGAAALLPRALPILRAALVPDISLAGTRVVAFAGIALPDKFFDTVAEAGAEIVGRRAFPDHHRFAHAELREVLDAAARANAVPVTTAKDAVRLPAEVRVKVRVLGVALRWEDEGAVEALLSRYVSVQRSGTRPESG